jgi:DNA-3-methyladenine glycosylase
MTLNCPDESYYLRSTEIVAKELIGKKLVHCIYDTHSKTKVRLSGIIIETEAYGFRNDPASHAYKGLTSRNKIMFSKVGRAYLYFIYGSHFCINISARSDKIKAGAVLLRSLQPFEGITIMKRLRNSEQIVGLTSGPGKITQALNINKCQNGMDMTDPKNELHIEFGIEPSLLHIIATKRIGISQATNKKWRFVCNDILNTKILC